MINLRPSCFTGHKNSIKAPQDNKNRMIQHSDSNMNTEIHEHPDRISIATPEIS